MNDARMPHPGSTAGNWLFNNAVGLVVASFLQASRWALKAADANRARKLTRDEERAARRERLAQDIDDFGCDPWDYE